MGKGSGLEMRETGAQSLREAKSHLLRDTTSSNAGMPSLQRTYNNSGSTMMTNAGGAGMRSRRGSISSATA